ncbi:MAG: hypothetical protein LBF77_01300 [Spirochaetaceae bacterium]|nr:hypothetical protein [Spirochaetaceae bacterium]
MLFLIDIGTSNFKAALADYDGKILRAVSLPLAIHFLGGGRCETDPALWLRAFEEAAAVLAPLSSVQALLISGNGPTVVPVTGVPSPKAGKLALDAAAARLWLDRRAGAEAETVSAAMGAYIDPSFFLPKILSVKVREQALYEKTRCFLAAPEYLVYALTGEARTVFPSRGFDLWYWNDRALEKLGLPGEKLPPFVFPGDEIGTLLPAVRTAFGFTSPVRVFAGGPDFFVSILGTGTVRPGQACDRSGTSEGFNVCTSERITDPRLMSYGHPVKGYWNLSGIISTTGKAVDWCRGIMGTGIDYDSFYALAEKSAPGAGGVVFLPYLAGERAPLWNPKAKGVFVGLSLETGREEIARSVAEGICFALRDVATVMEELEAPVSEIRVSGGTAGRDLLNQLKADIMGKPVLLPGARSCAGPDAGAGISGQFEAELTGLAALGAAALGKYALVSEAAEAMVTVRAEYYPRTGYAEKYAGLFYEFRELYRALKPSFERISVLGY